ncbi:MAG: nucleotidyltransferase domain-containing protein, partial [Flavisolibacter sp.]|nr:nucleotidyltransferase domain-containing protein [Flavisolibacter sp.]
MKSDLPILKQIKERVHRVNPSARIILFGSFARGDNRKDSDIDLLILVDEENISFHDK